MAIFSRVTDLLKANINDLIDRAEDPEKMVKQIIIDMEEQLQNAVQGLGSVMASEREMLKKLNEAKDESKLWEGRAKDALKSDNEELAKKAIDKKLTADTSVKQYQKMYDNISSQSETLREQVDLLKKKLVEARARQTMLVARDKVAEARKEVISAVGDLDSSGAFAKMDKMEKKIAEKEAQADAAFDISGMDDEEDDEFEEMENKKVADDELARLKEELSKE
ncbi:MAG: PspA/IM30 family protein [Actinobacteria bacterium]|jgi:phage shock protein A|nr:PspA/IM30 family protein [Actinomycetota bacterium]